MVSDSSISVRIVCLNTKLRHSLFGAEFIFFFIAQYVTYDASEKPQNSLFENLTIEKSFKNDWGFS